MASKPNSVVRRSLQKFQPAYFGLVMATGILAICCHLEGLTTLARAFVTIDVLAFIVLAVITALRLLLFPREFYRDLSDHDRGVGFFTIVAGVAVLGSALAVIFDLYTIPLALWVAGIVLWTLFTYTIFGSFIVSQNKPSLSKGIHGSWLLAVVSTEAIAQLALLLLPKLPSHQASILFLSLSLWLCGGMLYIWMISLIFYRYTFFVLAPSDFMPSYWIDMGAMAIATVVGSLLLERARGSSIADLAPFIKGFTILFWATATWWIPMLLILSVWRHLVRPVPIVYSPSYWSAVFPLGMYAVATYHLAEVMGMRALLVIPRYLVYVAIAAWALVGLGMLMAMLNPRGKLSRDSLYGSLDR